MAEDCGRLQRTMGEGSGLLKITNTEVMINGEGFTQRYGTAQVETQSLY